MSLQLAKSLLEVLEIISDFALVVTPATRTELTFVDSLGELASFFAHPLGIGRYGVRLIDRKGGLSRTR